MAKSFFTGLFLLLLIPLQPKAQDDLTNRIFKLSYNQKYDSATVLLTSNQPIIDPYYYAVLDIDLSYWKNVTGTDTPDYQAFEQTLSQYNLNSVETFDQKVIQLIMLSYQLRYQLKRYHIFDAISTRKKTLLLFNELKDQSTRVNSDQQELFRLYSALILYFDNYLKPFFITNKKENRTAALVKMEKLTHSENNITATLSTYFVGKIYLDYEKEFRKGALHFKTLSAGYPANDRFKKLYEDCIHKAAN
ncbi:hypothetical protein INQ51_20725 [Maribellus sp. CM-23]|uniref:hypothetical protein n=1 Tax=Maribellus sp. CM-23 TaxID=2781026 RepID=UPI001F2138DC|nr:hypothetical protein [Maribellus sp. CM-23]MCE4566758.1 hypothetical protein [Maribellus sp. CM-23]